MSNRVLNKIKQECFLIGAPVRYGDLAFEAWIFPAHQQLYRGGRLPSDPMFVFLCGDFDWGVAYLNRAIALGQNNLSLQIYESLTPLTLFVMSTTNLLKLLFRCDISDTLAQAIMHVTGSHLDRGSIYERHSLTARGEVAPMKKTVSKRRLQVHTHHYITSSNQATNTYAALKLAKEMRDYLQQFKFDGWVYPSAVPRASSSTASPLQYFHQEVLVWNSTKITKL